MTDVSRLRSLLPPQNVSANRAHESCELSPPYGPRQLTMDIRRLRSAWKRYRKGRRRQAIYSFLAEILNIVAIWRADGHAIGRTRKALLHLGCACPESIEPLRDLISVATKPATLDRRTLAKWTRVLRYADEYKVRGKPLDRFVIRRGGINGCAALYTRRLGRKARRSTAMEYRGRRETRPV